VQGQLPFILRVQECHISVGSHYSSISSILSRLSRL